MFKKSILALTGAALALPPFASAAQISDAPPVVGDVTVSASDMLTEETPDGANGEPEWVRQRRFSLTRIYIQQDPGSVGLESWFRTRTFDGGVTTMRSKNEIEIGLPNRMQLDIYENLTHENDGTGWHQEEIAFELRYAFADWNKIPGNPTLYVEYAFTAAEPDVLETKLLFGGELSQGWHWGVNFILEHELWGEETNEYGLSGGLSKTLIDNKLSVGLEANLTMFEDEDSEVILGPSVQWRPTENSHVDLVALAGLTDASPNTECWLIFGFDFGAGEKSHSGYKPTSMGR